MPSEPRVLFIGTFDDEHSRARIMRRLFERCGYVVDVRREEVWGARRYSALSANRARTALRALVAYVRLAVWSLRCEPPDLVVMLYPGHLDVLLLGPIWQRRRVPVVFDPLVSLYDTVVADRALHTRGSPIGRLSRRLDRWAFGIADLVITDTEQVTDAYVQITGLDRSAFAVVHPGAFEPAFSTPAPGPGRSDLVLFYGTFIALQGIPTIVRAAKLLEGDGVTVRLIGDGQETPAVDALIRAIEVGNLERVGRVPLEQLAAEIAQAGVCLGVFGSSEKADRVVPFKVFECLAMARPVVTGDTAAARELLGDSAVLVPVGDPLALADAVRALLADPARRAALARAGYRRSRSYFGEMALARRLAAHLERVTTRRPTGRTDDAGAIA
jgi:glycosyltransferase involved in cell wall biosynthesis